jgi:hypothetical protein
MAAAPAGGNGRRYVCSCLDLLWLCSLFVYSIDVAGRTFRSHLVKPASRRFASDTALTVHPEKKYSWLNP